MEQTLYTQAQHPFLPFSNLAVTTTGEPGKELHEKHREALGEEFIKTGQLLGESIKALEKIEPDKVRRVCAGLVAKIKQLNPEEGQKAEEYLHKQLK